jgi:hypothetical protein
MRTFPRTLAPRVEVLPDGENMELLEDSEEMLELAGESTLAEEPIPVENQRKEILRLADPHPGKPDEETLMALRQMYADTEAKLPEDENDDETEGPAADEVLDVRRRPVRHRHKAKKTGKR